jgi:hypothetical protein
MKDWAREMIHWTRAEDGDSPADEDVPSFDAHLEPWRQTSNFSRLEELSGSC